MLLRRVSVWSAILLSLAGIVALAKPNSLNPQITHNLVGQKLHSQGRQFSMEELNLTQEQKQQLQAIQQQYKGQMNQQRQKLLQSQQELTNLMAGTASQSQIRDKYRQVDALRQQMGELNLESMLAMREVLTLEQRKRFAQLMQHRKGKYRNPIENRRGQQF